MNSLGVVDTLCFGSEAGNIFQSFKAGTNSCGRACWLSAFSPESPGFRFLFPRCQKPGTYILLPGFIQHTPDSGKRFSHFFGGTAPSLIFSQQYSGTGILQGTSDPKQFHRPCDAAKKRLRLPRHLIVFQAIRFCLCHPPEGHASGS